MHLFFVDEFQTVFFMSFKLLRRLPRKLKLLTQFMVWVLILSCRSLAWYSRSMFSKTFCSFFVYVHAYVSFRYRYSKQVPTVRSITWGYSFVLDNAPAYNRIEDRERGEYISLRGAKILRLGSYSIPLTSTQPFWSTMKCDNEEKVKEILYHPTNVPEVMTPRNYEDAAGIWSHWKEKSGR